jgi:hypothetical protein
MLKKKKLFLLIALLFITGIGSIGYWLYLAPPDDFPDKKASFNKILDTFPEADIKEMQDVVYLDNKHVYVPFITRNESYGLSFWQWQKHQWTFISLDTGATPRIWKIDPENPASYVIIWNFHPENNLRYLTFYLIKDRGYSINDGKHNYQPRIHMDIKTELEGKTSFGHTQIPLEWCDFMLAENKLMSSLNPGPLFSNFFPPAQYYFGWRSVAKDGFDDYPPFPKNNNGFGTGDSLIEHIRYVDKQELQ